MSPPSGEQVAGAAAAGDEFSEQASVWPSRGAVFTYRRRRLRDFTTAFEAARERAGLGGIRVQDLRHTAIVRWLRAGVGLELAMSWAGLEAPASWSRYRRHGTTDASQAIALLAGLPPVVSLAPR